MISEKNEAEQIDTSKRRPRGCLTSLARIVAVLLIIVPGLALVGSFYEARAEAADALAYPPPGQMVDVGGYRLHINCTGSGSPTVIIEAGYGDWSASWTEVQAEVASTTQVCTYDRAGMGYSEAGPLPRNAEQFAKELHTLLNEANVPPPYVLVGHSMGGLPVRVYAHNYPTEVAGVVLIESMVPAQSTQPLTEITPSTSRNSPIPALVARIGIIRLLTGVNDAQSAFSVTPRSVQAVVDEGAGMPESFVQADTVKNLDDLPLIVLSRGLDQELDWQAWQTELLELSSQSEQLIADQSGHNVQLDQPEAAVAAIVRMVEQIRLAEAI